MLQAIWAQVRPLYPLTLTTTRQVDDGFTIDVPVITGHNGRASFWLYDDGGELVFSAEVPGQAYHDHWHPQRVSEAVEAISAFMTAR
jgi:hypothetical protein